MSTTPKSVPKPATNGPSRGKDTWRTPIDVVMLINRMYGGQDPPSWVEGLWKRDDGQAIYEQVCRELRESGCIDMDPCASPDDENTFAGENLTLLGLELGWSGKVFANPPYSATAEWLAYAAKTIRQAKEDGVPTQCLFLVPPNMCTSYWIDTLLQPRVSPEGPFEELHPQGMAVNLLATSRGRLAFLGDNGPQKNNTLGSAIVGWVDDPEFMKGILEEAGWVCHRPG